MFRRATAPLWSRQIRRFLCFFVVVSDKKPRMEPNIPSASSFLPDALNSSRRRSVKDVVP